MQHCSKICRKEFLVAKIGINYNLQLAPKQVQQNIERKRKMTEIQKNTIEKKNIFILGKATKVNFRLYPHVIHTTFYNYNFPK